jgi:hypothetical protein
MFLQRSHFGFRFQISERSLNMRSCQHRNLTHRGPPLLNLLNTNLFGTSSPERFLFFSRISRFLAVSILALFLVYFISIMARSTFSGSIYGKTDRTKCLANIHDLVCANIVAGEDLASSIWGEICLL